MSLVKASILHELDFSLNFKKWLQSKRENHYHTATISYSNKLRELFRESVRRKHQNRVESLASNESSSTVSSGLVVIRLGDNTNVENKPPQTKFNGICLHRSNFPGAQLDDKVHIVPLKEGVDPPEEDDSKDAVLGTVVGVESDHIRIKFKTTINLEIEEGSENANKEEEKEKEKLDELCEKHCHNDSDEEEKDANETNKQENGEKTEAKNSDEEDSAGRLEKLELSLDKKSDNQEENGNSNKNSVVHVKPANYGIKISPREDRGLSGFVDSFDTALRRFEKQSCSAALHRCLLGYYSNRDDSITPKSRVVVIGELPKLKHHQVLALEQSIKRRISLVEGPAGSGKTLIAAHVASNIARVKDYKVLVCSPLQSTVDTIVELIDRVTSVEVLKLPNGDRGRTSNGSPHFDHFKKIQTIGRRRSEDSDADLKSLSDCRDIDRLVDDEIYWDAWHKFKPIYRNDADEMHEQALRQVSCSSSWRRRKIEKRLLNQVNIVCCTTLQVGSPLIEDLSFDMLILDDAQLISEIDCFMPLMAKGLKQVTMLSDMRDQIRLARVKRMLSASMPSHERKSTDPIGTATEDNTIEGQDQKSSPNVDDHPKKENESTSKEQNGTMNFSQTLAERRRAKQKSMNERRGLAKTPGRNVESASDVSEGGQNSTSGPSDELGGLFERWLAIGLPAVDLRHQFRMHETLSSFPNYHFYLSRSKNDQKTNEKLTNEILENLLHDESNFDWLPRRNALTAMFQSKSVSINRDLDDLIEKLLDKENVQGKRIGVIFNRKQDSFADKWQSRSIEHNDSVCCGTIENFLGQERDFIILVAGCCDAKKASQFADLACCSKLERNFMMDDRTLNLALTRARLAMFILTDYELPTSQTQENGQPSTSGTTIDNLVPYSTDHYCFSWRKLFEYYEMNKLIPSPPRPLSQSNLMNDDNK